MSEEQKVKPIWTARKYSSYQFSLSKNIGGSVCWRSLHTGKDWLASSLNTSLGDFDSLEDAKLAVETHAERELQYALDHLRQARKDHQ